MKYPRGATVGSEICAHLGRQRRSQTWLATQLDMDQTSLSRRLTGARSMSIDDMAAIARVLGVSVADLIPQDFASAS